MFVVVRAKRGFVMWVCMVCLGQMEALVVAIVAVLMEVSMFVAVRVAMQGCECTTSPCRCSCV